MNKNWTDITIVLDRSGSMQRTKADTIGGFNQFIKDQREVAGEAWVSLVQFNDKVEECYSAMPINKLFLLDDPGYRTTGNTALLDAIGGTINSLGARLGGLPEEKRPGNVIFVIITDGYENASKEFGYEQVAEMIKHQREKYSWQFVFIGADQDAIAAAARFNIPASSALSNVSNSRGIRAAYSSLSHSVSNTREYNVPIAFDETDLKAQSEAAKDNS